MKKDNFSQWKNTMQQYNKTPYSEGITPRNAIWKKNKATLWFYPASNKKYNVPVFIVYSLINQPFILDLLPGGSSIEAYVNNGYDVYLLDFGIPGLEDKNLTLNDYITEYIQKGVQRALIHSNSADITLMGYCLGGTLVAIYGAIAEEPISNMILVVTPIDFSSVPFFDKWATALKEGRITFDDYYEELGIIPASHVEAGVRLITSPFYYTPYLSLLLKAHDKAYVDKWNRFNTWTKGHIPLAGKVFQQIAKDLFKDNKLVDGQLSVSGKVAKLSNIKSNLLVLAAENDRLVPKEQSYPIMNLVSSADKIFHVLDGGHTGLTVQNGKMPPYLVEWLPQRSKPIN